jgi:hypothetical protein
MDLGRCWSCEKKLTAKAAVWLDENLSIPCCKKCWQQIPIGKRLELAQQFYDRSDRGLGVEITLSMIRDLIHSANEGYMTRRMDKDLEN